MKTENKVSKFFFLLGSILLLMGLLSVDLGDFSFEVNKGPYRNIILGALFLMIFLYKVYKEKNTNQIKE
ncbi:hypothetical protein SAMN04488062_101148 [Flavobacterium omnivorum]|uniref:Uncharacterized protein n=1 Tax=Flavobacterium omnivorum TaxID=178355 RepID=A0A1G7VSD7_9FLAO|nr:hypothetical protein [Flavobacterium omnivorum]SDG62726.1 hypothetical protein SAMN04488062_101148 [Flavobacterium omnivorum]